MSRRSPFMAGGFAPRRARFQANAYHRPRTFDRPLRIEPLEDRRLLAVVSTLSDVVDGNFTPGNLSLREAIANAAIAEVISFSVTGTIQLTNVNHAGEIAIAKSLTIQGPGAGLLTIRAHRGVEATVGDGSRIFNIDDGMGLDQNVILSGLTMSGGDVNGSGGAILSRENLIISFSTFSSNATSDVNGNSGGAIYNQLGGELRIGACTFSNNHAGDGGGAIFNETGAFTLATSTLSGNTARFSGGALFHAGGLLTLYNSTISANAAGFAGGGIINSAGVAVLGHVTITGNSAPNGTGSGIASVDNGSTNTQLYSTIVSANANSDDVGIVVGGVTNRFTSLGHNLIGGGTAAAAFAASERGITNPGLAALANNGGPTMTHALLPGSLAINAGDPTLVAGGGYTYDQRGDGFTRVFGNRVDVGAYEYQQLVTAVVDTQADELDSNRGPGDLSLREAIEFADVITFAPNVHLIQLVTELSIVGSVDIRGPGAGSLVIQTGAIRLFNIDNGTSAAADVSLSGMTLTGANTTTNDGGAVFNRENLTIDACRIVGNTARLGGGIYNAGSLTMSGSTVDSNSASGGAGVYNEGLMTVTASTVSSNIFEVGGGGFYNTGVLSLTNCTISSNTSVSVTDGSVANSGGGIHNSGVLDAAFTTIALNRAAYNVIGHMGAFAKGGGIWTPPGATTTLTHVLLAGNIVYDFVNQTGAKTDNLKGGGQTTLTFSLDTDSTPVQPLAGNGGPTLTHAPTPGGAAINAGNPALTTPGMGTPPNDQRGAPYTRISGGRIDIGAFEVQPPPNPTASADFDSDNDRDGADFLRWQRGLGATGAAATRANGNADNDNDVDAADLAVWRAQFAVLPAVANVLRALELPKSEIINHKSEISPSPAAIDAAIAAYHHLHTEPLIRSSARRLLRPR